MIISITSSDRPAFCKFCFRSKLELNTSEKFLITDIASSINVFRTNLLSAESYLWSISCANLVKIDPILQQFKMNFVNYFLLYLKILRTLQCLLSNCNQVDFAHLTISSTSEQCPNRSDQSRILTKNPFHTLKHPSQSILKIEIVYFTLKKG